MSEDLQRHLRSRSDEWEFLQVVRALERFTKAEAQARRKRGHEQRGAVAAAGDDAARVRRAPPPIRFRTHPGMAFPASEVQSVVSRDEEIGARDSSGGRREVARVWDVAVNFMGMNGATGVMPRSDVGEALYLAGAPNNRALLGLFDLVGAPFIALFGMAMRKYRAPLQWERAAVVDGVDHPAADRLEAALLALLGSADPSMRDENGPRFQVRQLVRLGAAFASPQRTPAGLAGIVSALLGVPAEVRQFQTAWRTIPEEDRTRLGGRYGQLGRNAVLGGRFCDIAAGVEIAVGPVDLPLFIALLPSGRLHGRLADLVAMYAGHHLRIRLRPILRAGEVPGSRLGGGTKAAVSLGRSSWLACRTRDADFADTVVPLSAFDEEGCRA